MDKRVFISLFFLISIPFAAHAINSGISANNYTFHDANSIINSTEQYIHQINESGYLFINPDLSSAYSYLDKAKAIAHYSPVAAISYANQAEDSAASAYAYIRSFYEYALLGITVFTLAMAVLLYRFMKPVNTPKDIKRRKSAKKKTR